jgi:hypothetical protein
LPGTHSLCHATREIPGRAEQLIDRYWTAHRTFRVSAPPQNCAPIGPLTPSVNFESSTAPGSRLSLQHARPKPTAPSRNSNNSTRTLELARRSNVDGALVISVVRTSMVLVDFFQKKRNAPRNSGLKPNFAQFSQAVR